jgi:hypothetical protein
MKRALLLGLGLLAAAGAPSPARAQDIDACAASYERAQELRQAGKLVESRAQLLVCAQAACPRLTTPECTRWLREVDDALPTVVFSARDGEGRDVVDVTVSIDGAKVEDRLDGKPLLLNPGQHDVRFERAGESPIVQRILVRQGEKDRAVVASFPRHLPPPPPPRVQVATRVAPVAYLLGALGVVAAGTGIALDLVASNDLSNLRSSCAPYCSSGALPRAKTKMIVVALPLAPRATSLAGGIWLAFHPKRIFSDEKPRVGAGLVVAPAPGGAVVGMDGRF